MAALACAVATTFSAHATLFGPEWTFTNAKLIKEGNKLGISRINSIANVAAQRRMVSEIKLRCEECKLTVLKSQGLNVYRFTYPDGWWFQVALDPSVIEVQAKPETPARFRELAPRIQRDIFDAAAQVKLKPHKRTGGGHINVDRASAFKGDRLLYRNYLVDKMNHAELARGVLGEHLLNAPPLSMLGDDAVDAFRDVIDDFDANPAMTIEELDQRIVKDVYKSTYFKEIPQVSNFPDKYQAVHLSESDRVELRYPRPQTSAEDWNTMIEYEEGRLAYLQKLGAPLPVEIPPEQIPIQEKVRRFHRTVLENGQDWARMRKLLAPDFRKYAPPAPPPIPNYDEVFGPDGIVRPAYRGVYDVYYGMTPKKRGKIMRKTFKASKGARALHPMPRMLEKKEWEKIKKGSEQRARALKALLKDVVSKERSYAKAGVLPAHIVDDAILRARNGGLTGTDFHGALNPDAMGFFYGPDLVRGPDGEFLVMEDNVGFLGGMGDSTSSREDLLKFAPEYGDFVRSDQGKGFVENLARELKAQAIPPGGEVILVYHKRSAGKEPLLRQLKRHGVRCITTEEAAKLLIREQNGVFLKQGGKRLPVGAIFPSGVALTDFTALGEPSLLELSKKGKLLLAYPPGVDFLSDKNITPHIENLIRFYLKEEPILKAPETILFADANDLLVRENFDRVARDPAGWVIKRPEGLGGHEVWIGNKMSKEEFAQLLEKVRIYPAEYQAQRFVPLSVIDGHLTDSRIPMFVGPKGVVTGDHPWGRALPLDGDGKVNMTQKGIGNAVFVVDSPRNQAVTRAYDGRFPDPSPDQGLPIHQKRRLKSKGCIPGRLDEILVGTILVGTAVGASALVGPAVIELIDDALSDDEDDREPGNAPAWDEFPPTPGRPKTTPGGRPTP